MIRSILLKEGLKLRWVFLAALAVNVAFCVKVFLDIRQQMNTEHAQMVWYQAVHLQTVFQYQMRHLPLLTGLALAAAQFVPELLGRRMRIALHLPVARETMLVWCLLAGLGHVLVVIGMVAGLTHLTMTRYFPAEVSLSALATMAPWYAAGLMGYLGAAVLFLEPGWPRRLFLGLMYGTAAFVLLMGLGYGWFTPALPWLVILLPLALLGVFEPCRRFHQGGA
ncbi:hypothetical protein [Desulfonatronum lacustre]|uniref:hypothetical protein n=1 Tax=Desulfonatronum lacustre TaxID=66849 RepID=UPI0004B82B76|nr:hypothetical protein [Desulfonatronum lacustre]